MRLLLDRRSLALLAFLPLATAHEFRSTAAAVVGVTSWYAALPFFVACAARRGARAWS